jgi:hypothetical protein
MVRDGWPGRRCGPKEEAKVVTPVCQVVPFPSARRIGFIRCPGPMRPAQHAWCNTVPHIPSYPRRITNVPG